MPELDAKLQTELRERLQERMEALRERSRHLEIQGRAEPGRMREPRDASDRAAGSVRDHTRGHVDDVLRDEIQRIEDALDRMDRNAYGRCSACGEPIQVERLRAEPHAVHCVDCARRLES